MAILSFQKPDKILLQKATDFEGTFEFAPLEPGFGNTIGNALRRVLLSSLEGYAITNIKIAGINHEFSTIKGVIEDVTEMVLNIKQVRLKRILQDADAGYEKIYISLKNKEQFTAGDIEAHTNVFAVTNPDLVICNMEKNVNLELEISIGKGRGYVAAEEHYVDSSIVGLIPVDSIYTPIKNVRYKIENTRVEQRTDFEKLIIDVKTDGTIHPEDAVKEAAKILIQHLMLVSDENITFDSEEKGQEEVVDEHILHMRKILKTPLEDLDLSVRAYNCLKAAKINSLSELVQYDTNELLKFRNFGRKSLVEIEELIIEKGMHFGMDLSKFKLED
ncbi:MAG TPA: DNA-directed RNA polymerase subunit alpha [Chitinophagales bacterium]|jgi:DNA-directed RNA polymerase subunit alpha|nr:DNA-directed RNA polymerase subunit alpha [Chitinophagales bacterium]HQV77963.1 DNA-directed RNA polymerase subunit alpha [Chitinophagales bacterium]HQW78685.1 DNA-directed RNA polymerase subunit alpha [Chitinophagales bacterium]HRB18466.1 DNA-directed RNA polymerase subunit alpha [Chitinophagales bacterium]HRB66308.1 DNA-directed RNA polymerase subunit alpha [Chitinophagales bacterium]